MSHQGFPGWFPECIVCRMGNVGPVVCLDPTCHEAQPLAPIVLEATGLHEGDLSIGDTLQQADGHFWKSCQRCERHVLADPGAFGVYALCVACYNLYAGAHRQPPTTPWEAEVHERSGILIRERGCVTITPA